MSVTIEVHRPARVWLKKLRLVQVATLLWLPTLGYCYEVTLGVDSAYVHESNFYRSPNNEVDADSIEIGGTLSIERQEGRLRYLASYSGSYQAYRDQDEADAPQHRLRLRGSFDIDPTTTVYFNNNYRDIKNLRYSREDILDGDAGLVANEERYQRNDLELLLHRDITRSWELEINAKHQLVDFERNVNRSDSESIEIGGRVLHRFAARHRIGGGLAWVEQDFDGADVRLDSEAEYLIADLAWIFDIAEHVQLVVNGGPAWISTDQDVPGSVQQTQFVGESQGDESFRANVRSCDFDEAAAIGIASRCDFSTPGAEPIPADDLGDTQNFPLGVGPNVGNEEEVTFFGGAAVKARIADWTVDVDLRQKQSATSGDAIAASLSRLRWEFGYDPARTNWDAYLAGSWERRETISDSATIDYLVIPGPEEAAQRSQAFTRVRDSDDYRDSFTALVGVETRFTRSLSGAVEFRYRHTEERVSGRKIDTDSNFFVVSISYVFDKMRF